MQINNRLDIAIYVRSTIHGSEKTKVFGGKQHLVWSDCDFTLTVLRPNGVDNESEEKFEFYISKNMLVAVNEDVVDVQAMSQRLGTSLLDADLIQLHCLADYFKGWSKVTDLLHVVGTYPGASDGEIAAAVLCRLSQLDCVPYKAEHVAVWDAVLTTLVEALKTVEDPEAKELHIRRLTFHASFVKQLSLLRWRDMVSVAFGACVCIGGLVVGTVTLGLTFNISWGLMLAGAGVISDTLSEKCLVEDKLTFWDAAGHFALRFAAGALVGGLAGPLAAKITAGLSGIPAAAAVEAIHAYLLQLTNTLTNGYLTDRFMLLVQRGKYGQLMLEIGVVPLVAAGFGAAGGAICARAEVPVCILDDSGEVAAMVSMKVQQPIAHTAIKVGGKAVAGLKSAFEMAVRSCDVTAGEVAAAAASTVRPRSPESPKNDTQTLSTLESGVKQMRANFDLRRLNAKVNDRSFYVIKFMDVAIGLQLRMLVKFTDAKGLSHEEYAKSYNKSRDAVTVPADATDIEVRFQVARGPKCCWSFVKKWDRQAERFPDETQVEIYRSSIAKSLHFEVGGRLYYEKVVRIIDDDLQRTRAPPRVIKYLDKACLLQTRMVVKYKTAQGQRKEIFAKSYNKSLEVVVVPPDATGVEVRFQVARGPFCAWCWIKAWNRSTGSFPDKTKIESFRTDKATSLLFEIHGKLYYEKVARVFNDVGQRCA